MNIALLIYTVIFFAFLYFTCSRFEYWPNVAIYTIGMGLIPALFTFNGFASLLIVILFRFIVGLILIKILTKANDYFQSSIYFFVIGLILEGFITRFVLAFIITMLTTI